MFQSICEKHAAYLVKMLGTDNPDILHRLMLTVFCQDPTAMKAAEERWRKKMQSAEKPHDAHEALHFVLQHNPLNELQELAAEIGKTMPLCEFVKEEAIQWMTMRVILEDQYNGDEKLSTTGRL